MDVYSATKFVIEESPFNGFKEPSSRTRYDSRYMKDSLSYRGATLWNFVNYNDTSATLNFNQLWKQDSSEDYFIDFKFEFTSASAIRCRQHNFIYY